MEYLVFSFWFMLIHTAAYMLAGMLALRISKDIYEGKSRLMDYLRDMSVEDESKHVQKWVFPSQLLRGLLISVVLYPVLAPLGEMGFGLRFAFLAGLMFVYTDLACAVPFPSNIEGFVYMKERFFKKSTFLKFQFEMIIYSLILGFLTSYFLF